MTLQTISIGTAANDGSGDTVRDAFDKVNDNFSDAGNAASKLVGSTTGRVPTVDDLPNVNFPSLQLNGVSRSSWGEPVVSGTATSGSTTALNDTTKNWGTDSLQNMIVAITGGTGAGQTRTIASNATTQIVPSSNFTTAPNNTSTYAVYAISNQTLSQVVETEGAFGCVANLTTAVLLALNLSSAHAAQQSLGGREFQYMCESDVTHVDRYGVLKKSVYYSGTPTATGVLSVTNSGAAWTVGELENYVAYLTDGSNVAYRWVVGNSATQFVYDRPIAFTPTSYKLSKPRFEANGLLVEGVSTNYIRNNTMQGAAAGTPGTMPTNWFDTFVGNGLSRDVVGTGQENGIAYIDVRYYGTSTANVARILRPETLYSLMPAVVGDMYTFSAWVKIVAGSVTGLDTFTFRQTQLDGIGTSLGALPGTDHRNTLTSSLQRLHDTGTMSAVGTAFTLCEFRGYVATGTAIDVTLRIGLPQQEKLPFATSVIRTTSAAVTRTNSVANVPYIGNMPAPSAEQTWIAEADMLGDQYALIRDIVSVADEVYRIMRAATPSYYRLYHGPSGFSTNFNAIAGMTRYGYRVSGSTLHGFVNGSKSTTGSAVSTVTGSGAGIRLGRYADSTYLYGHLLSLHIYDRALTDAEMRLGS